MVRMTRDLDDQREFAAALAGDYPATPPHTRRGVQHHVTEVEGVYRSHYATLHGWPLIVGRTRCGKRDLLMDRTVTNWFPCCRRCYPTAPSDNERGEDS